MRILAIVADEVTYQPLVYEPIVQARKGDILGIVTVSFQTKQQTGLSLLRFLFQLYGVKGFIFKTLQVLRAKFMDMLSRFVKLDRCYSLRGIAHKYNIPLYPVTDISSEDFLKFVEELRPDIILSSQGHVVGRPLLSIPKIGVLNKHAGMLPHYRGIYPVFWAMLNREDEIGVTVHFMNEKLDDGDILCQETIPVTPEDTFESLYRRVVEITPKLFLTAIESIEKGNYARHPNEKEKATYYGYPTPDDIKKFKQMGLRII
ncbi:MAG: formyl transferase [Thermodesulfobacteriota bacterium]|jgi:methionyl-tRNA formyltransferase